MSKKSSKNTISYARFVKALNSWHEASGLNKTKAAEFFGLPQSNYSNVLAGKRELSLWKMEEIAQKIELELSDMIKDPALDETGQSKPRFTLVHPPHVAQLSEDDIDREGFLRVSLSDSKDMRLAAGGGGFVPTTHEAAESPVVVYGPALGRRSNYMLHAFRVGGSSMEPVIAEGGLIIADLAQNEWGRLIEGAIYVICWDLYDGECAVKYLSWHDEGKTVLLESANRLGNPPKVIDIEETRLVGQVIWAWREF